MRYLFLFMSCCFLCSCIQSENPLSDPNKASIDKRLEGIWLVEDTDSVNEIIFYRFTSRDDGFMDLVIDDQSKKDLNIERFSIFPTKLNTGYYMNVKKYHPKNIEGGYSFYKYKVTNDNTLYLWAIFDIQPVVKAINDNSLRGEIKREKDGTIDSVEITDVSIKIAEFVSSHDQELFKEPALRLRKQSN